MTPRSRLLVSLAAVASLAALVSPAAHATIVGRASQPKQVGSGPGSNGQCGVTQSSFDNAAAPGNPVYVFQPKGIAATAMTGGHCNDAKRPAVFIAHGLGGTDPSNYIALITHLVSNGNVVVYPTYQVTDGKKSTLENANRSMDAGNVQAVRLTPRIDVTRVGFWGHSMGASMVPYLVVQAGRHGWGTTALWMNNDAMTFALLVGPDAIHVPANTQVLTVGFEDDELADNRIGDEVFEALTVPASQKRHLIVNTDPHGQPALVADHNAPIATNAATYRPDAIDFFLWRDLDLLETCALANRRCAADFADAGKWSDGTPIVPGVVAQHPVDVGPYPALLAECDGVYGQQLNQQRMHRCGATHI
jgi:acetyl esterase/lipase